MSEGLLYAKGKKAAEAVYAGLSSERKTVLQALDYRSVWNELYFNELTTIISKNWEHFQTRIGTEKGKFIAWMDQVNACRSDAHSKSLSSDDLAFLRVAFKRLEEALELS